MSCEECNSDYLRYWTGCIAALRDWALQVAWSALQSDFATRSHYVSESVSMKKDSSFLCHLLGNDADRFTGFRQSDHTDK